MAVIDDLKARRATVAAQLAAMSLGTVGDKPNANTADGGTTVDHVGYRDSLYRELKMLDELILNAGKVEEALANQDGSWEIETQVYS